MGAFLFLLPLLFLLLGPLCRALPRTENATTTPLSSSPRPNIIFILTGTGVLQTELPARPSTHQNVASLCFSGPLSPLSSLAFSMHPCTTFLPSVCCLSVLFATDDQDQLLGGSFPATAPGGATPMPKTVELLQKRGAMATNAFIHTPVCCPSRAETLTGRYLHNLKTPGRCKMGYDGFDEESGGACCMHVEEDKVHDFSFMRRLRDAGYATGLFGKYLNFCPGNCSDECSGEPIPEAFDSFLGNGGGHYYSPSFAVKNLAGLPDGTFSGSPEDYTTAVVGNHSVRWIRSVAAASPGKPFVAYVAPKACHDPFLPAPWYRDFWSPSWPSGAPRPPSFNLTRDQRKGHHHTVANMGPITGEVATCIDNDFKDRWRTLMSVDDVVEALVATVEDLGLLNNTYFIYSSDHGYSVGELNLNWDKRNVYDFDTRIHLLVRGPGIKPGTTFAAPLTNVDIAPTIQALAGVSSLGGGGGGGGERGSMIMQGTELGGRAAEQRTGEPSGGVVDGRSLLPFLIDKDTCLGVGAQGGGGGGGGGGRSSLSSPLSSPSSSSSLPPPCPETVRRELAATFPSFADVRRAWRKAVYMEYAYVGIGPYCSMDEPIENPDSNFVAVRYVGGGGGGGGDDSGANMHYGERDTGGDTRERASATPSPLLYARFVNGTDGSIDFGPGGAPLLTEELFFDDSDKWQTRNVFDSAPAALKASLRQEVQAWWTCAGESCP